MTIQTIAIHTISVCVGCLSLTILGLVANGVELKDQLEYAAPSDLRSTGLSLLFWPACGGIVDCCLFLFLWLKTPLQDSERKITKRYLNALLFVASFFFLRPLIVLIYTPVDHSVEAWACVLSNRGRDGTAESLCRELRSARFLLIPLFVLGVIFLALVAWLRFGGYLKQTHSDSDTTRNTRSNDVEV
ncbi:hypothetical protein C7974DRAFT_390986 [Boeremia exigua]|uniref:uncharacterized protein n=1 Tax=Boeremia exigua TaxID=749465 RepID=UPI001E8D67BA|nr:uncharacterized protein C7974DRAFT_390986 [Boeremia exigua]KAH6638165.1 hypothetical protein C7974DRAFT_390986 [Boeremia exigua]